MPRLAANLTMMFNEVGFLDRFQTAAASGFKGVEYLFPYAYDKDDIADRLSRHGLVQVLHNLPSGDWDAGERGIACHPDRIGEFQDGVGLAMDYAATLGCKQINCLSGIAPDGLGYDALREVFVNNLRFASTNLESAGIRLLIEPINTRDIPGFYLRHTAQARSIIEEVGSENLWIQHDIYHAQVMEGDLASTIEANLDLIRHVQIADNPGRNEPGTGEINYGFLLPFLDQIGYDGWVGCEYRPLKTTETSLNWARTYLV